MQAREEIDRLTAIITALQRHRFGRRSEQLDPDQLALALEDVEQTLSATEAEAENEGGSEARISRAVGEGERGALPLHLPREEVVLDVADKSCACCGGLKLCIGEDASERLDVVPAQFKAIVTRRPKYACRACQGEAVQAAASERLIENGVPTEAAVADVIVAKYADHLPLYRQAQIYARQGIELDRSAPPTGSAGPLSSCGRCMFACSSSFAALVQAVRRRDDGAGARSGPRPDQEGQLWTYARDERPISRQRPAGGGLRLRAGPRACAAG